MTHPAPVQATPPHRPLIDDADFTLYVGSAIDVLRTLPDESVHCVVTSPPYWGLRDYGTGEWSGGEPDCDHKQETRHQLQGATSQRQGRSNAEDQRNENFRDVCGKCGATRTDRQLGLEPTPEAYVARMVEVFREARRVLRRDGTCWLNLGDSYASNPGKGGSGPGAKQGAHVGYGRPMRPGAGRADGVVDQRGQRNRDGTPTGHGLKEKDLVGIPWRVAFALQADGWYLRSEIIWAKKNCMPESVTDRPTKSHEQIFLLTRSPRYYFDQEAIREPHKPDGRTKTIHAHAVDNSHENYANMGTDQERWPNGGRNARSVWDIATQPYAEAHFATFPEELPRKCIAAGTSERGCCPECGAPWERETNTIRDDRTFEREQDMQASSARRSDGSRLTSGTGHRTIGGTTPSYRPPAFSTTGWRPTCDCVYQETHRPEALPIHGLRGGAPCSESARTGDVPDVPGVAGTARALAPVPCVVLDPFAGSGTVALVARKLGRRSVGIELNAEYAQLAARRLQQLSLLA